MNDSLYIGHFKGLDIAFTCAVTTQTVTEIIMRHDCDPPAAHLLGRALTGALLRAAILSDGQRLNACWRYKGILRTIVADAGQDGSVRAFIAPAQLNLTEDNPDALYGDLGDLQVVTSQDGKILNSGTAPISLHDVAKDLAYYFCISDQVETGLCVLIGFNADPTNPIRLCQGWMLQSLPGANPECFDRLRNRMETPAFRHILSQAPADEHSIEAIAQELAASEPGYKGLSMKPGPTPQFVCPCSREKIEAVVRTLPIPERMEMVKKKGNAVVQCQFCNQRYELSVDECIAVWNRK